jgi:radical SAM protein with 4Fe4S-binding SPASM domain
MRPAKRSTYLDEALMIFSGEGQPQTLSERLYCLLFKELMNLIAKTFSTNPTDLKAYFRDPVIRRGVSSVLRGIAKYGITRPQVLGAPFLVVWNLTNMCNLRCKHCYQNAGVLDPRELSLEEKIRLVDELDEAGVVSVALSGGEPLIHPHFFPVVEEIVHRGMAPAVATNGTVLTKKLARRLKKAELDYLEISLDSVHPKVHDEFRGVPGAWNCTVEGIRNSVEAGIYTAVATTFTRMNVAEASEMIDFVASLGAQRFIHFNFIPTGRGAEMADLDLSPEEREMILRTIYEKARTSGIEALSTAPQYARVCLQQSSGITVAPTHFYLGTRRSDMLKVLAEFIGGCGAGRLYCAIQPDGDVTPCVFIPEWRVGSIRMEPFTRIWRRMEGESCFYNRDLLKESCGTCSFRHVCGGCRARAISYLNDAYGPDVGCINNLERWNTMIRSKVESPAKIQVERRR